MGPFKPPFGSKPDLSSPRRKNLALDLPMLGKGDLQDYSKNIKNGLITNNGATWTAGEFGPVLRFGSGTDFLLLPSGYRGIDGLSNFAIRCKCLTTDLASDNGIFYTSRHSAAHPLLFWFDNAATDHINVIINGASGGTGTLSSAFVPVENTLYDLMLVVTAGNSIRLYINGVEDTGGSFPFSGAIGGLDASEVDYRFGNDDINSKQFKGIIEFCQIYAASLSSAELKAQHDDPWAAYRRNNLILWAGAQVSPTGGINPLTGLLEMPSRLIA